MKIYNSLTRKIEAHSYTALAYVHASGGRINMRPREGDNDTRLGRFNHTEH